MQRADFYLREGDGDGDGGGVLPVPKWGPLRELERDVFSGSGMIRQGVMQAITGLSACLQGQVLPGRSWSRSC